MLELFGLHELMNWRAAFLCVRVEKVCKVFRVCVHACPVDCALCTTARKSRELLFGTKNMFVSFSRVNFFSCSFFYSTFYHVDSCFTIYIVKLKPWKASTLQWNYDASKTTFWGGIFVHLLNFWPSVELLLKKIVSAHMKIKKSFLKWT